MALIVVEGVVLGRAVVPKSQGARLPVQARHELVPGRVLDELGAERDRLLAREVGDPDDEAAVHVEDLLSGLGVGPDDRMADATGRLLDGLGLRTLGLAFGPVLVEAARAVDVFGGVLGLEILIDLGRVASYGSCQL